MKSRYDVIVVGAGPSGSTAARFAAANGASVIVFEKDREIGVPVRCAEGVSEASLSRFIEPNPKWVAATIDKFRFYSPTKRIVDLYSNEKGIVLHRHLFDQELAVLAVNSGAEIYTKAYVHGLERKNNQTEVYVQHLDREITITARIVIAADGIESRIARFAGISTNLKLKDIESCAQVLAGNVDINPERTDFYLSCRWAPGGYVWVFPKGERIANIGLGVNGAMSGGRSAMSYLDSFLNENFPDAARLATIAGGVPIDNNLSELVADGFMVVGDAAHQVNPMTGGGILAAMNAGQMAGSVAAEAIRIGNTSKKNLQEYEKEWNKSVGKDYKRFYRLKEWIRNLTDQDFENIAQAFEKVDPSNISLKEIFKLAVKNKPSLILDVLKVFATF